MARSYRVSVTLPDDVHEALVEESELTGRGVSDLIRDAVTQMLAGHKWQNIGEVAEKAIRNGMSNQQALNAVLKQFPKAKTSLDSIAWYRSKLRRQGEKIPTDTQARRF